MRTGRLSFSLVMGVAALLLFVGNVSFGQSKSDSSRTKNDLSSEQESTALAFAKEHHPELAQLVVRLKEKMTDEYDKAIRQLFVTSERLSRVQERSEEDYELQLSMWKVDSRIKLLGARMSISADRKLERQMRELLEQRAELKLTQLRREQDKLQTRLERTESAIQSLEQGRDSLIEKELERYRRLQPRTKAVSTKNKPSENSRQRDKSAPTETRTKK